jgi:hypothetical protein
MDRRAKPDTDDEAGNALPARVEMGAVIDERDEEARHRRSYRQYGGSGCSRPRARRMREARDGPVLPRGASGCIRFC